MGFLGTHRQNILNEVVLPSWRNIKRGEIITGNYRSETTNKVKFKMYIVLHTYWPSGADGKMHVLDMDYISLPRLKGKLMRHTMQKEPLQEIHRGKTFTRLDFRLDERNLYKSIIKPLINDGFGDSYRTIFPMNLTKIRAVNYEWDENKSADDQGITKREFLKEQEAKQSKQTRDEPDNPINDRHNMPGNRADQLDKNVGMDDPGSSK